jgi:hypothetical protein
MRPALCSFTVAVTMSFVCQAQSWELGAIGGYGWYHDSSITNGLGSALFRFGGPELKPSG